MLTLLLVVALAGVARPEIGGAGVGQSWHFLPLLIAGIGLVAGFFLLRQYLLAWQEARRLRLGSPLWLIPVQEKPDEDATASLGDEVMSRFNYQLDYEQRERVATLQQQVRRLARGLAAAGAVALLGLGWFGVSQRTNTSQPMDALPGTSIPTSQAPAPIADLPAPQAELPLVAPERLPARGTPTGLSSGQPPARQPTLAQAVAPAPAPPPQTQPQPQPAVAVVVPADTLAAVRQPPMAVVTPPPAATPATPAVDPAALGRAAAVVLQRGAVQAVAAINRADVAELRDRNGSSSGWSAEMLRSVQELKPTATIGEVPPPVLSGTHAETKFPVTFRWRGNFGVNRSKSVNFAATARLEQNSWVLVAVWPLEKFP